MGGPEPRVQHSGVGRLDRLGVEVADHDQGPDDVREPGDQLRRLLRANGLVGDLVVQVGDDEFQAGAGRERHGNAQRRAVPAQLQAVAHVQPERLASEDGVAVLGPAGPAAAAGVVPVARGAENPVLLHGEDTFLEPDQVRLERGHVGQEERDPLAPAVRDVAEVEGRDEKPVGSVDGAARVSHRRFSWEPQR